MTGTLCANSMSNKFNLIATPTLFSSRENGYITCSHFKSPRLHNVHNTNKHNTNKHREEQMDTNTENSHSWDWLTINGFIKFTNHQITENQLRWLLRSRFSNGLNEHVKTIGRKIYINKQGFIRWLENNV